MTAPHYRRPALIFALVFFGIPLLSAFFGFRQVAAEREISRREALELRLEETLSSAEAGANTQEFMALLLQLFEKRIFIRAGSFPPKSSRTAHIPGNPEIQEASGVPVVPIVHGLPQKPENPHLHVVPGDPTFQDSATVFRKLAPLLKKRFPGIFEFTYLDGDGRIVPELCDGPAPRVLLRRFFADYKNFLAGNSPGYEQEKGFIQSFLGPFLPVSGELHEKLHYASAKSYHRFVYITRPRSNGMLIVHLNQPQGWDEIAVRMRVAAHNRGRRDIHLAIVSLDQRLSQVFAPLGLDISAGKTVWRYFRNHIGGRLWDGPTLWARRIVFPQLSLLGMVRLPEDTLATRRERLLIIGLFLFWLLLANITQRIMDGRLPLYFSVRTKLILAFLYTAAVPLIVMGITARTYLSEHRQVLESRLHSDVEKAMITFDNTFPHIFTPMENTLQSIFARLVGSSSATVAPLIPELMKIQSSFAAASIRVFDKSGKPVFEHVETALRSLRNEDFSMFDRVASTLLRNLNSNTKAAGTAGNKKQQTDSTDVEWALSYLTRELGRVTKYELGPGKFLISMLPVFDQDKQAVFLALLTWSRTRLERQYIEKNLVRYARQLFDTDLYAFHRQNPTLSLPRPFRFQRMVKRFRERVRSINSSIRERRPGKNDTLLLTGIRGRELSEFNLIAVTNDIRIRQELDNQAWKFGFTALVMIFISATVGTLLAHAFLTPIASLSAGVAALRAREFETTIPVHDNDELGRLSAAFNGMTEGLADLELARVVQESLFPDKPLTMGGWCVHGTCQAASQVGGDYFDYFPIDDRRMIIIIGDVSGHGVSAALVVAMAKAIIAHPDMEPDPAKILTALHTVIAGVLKRKKLMTCFCIVFDTVTGKTLHANAGHNYPWLIREGRAEEIEAPGFPLGISRQRPFVSCEIELRPGNTLFLYTDGLVEALDRSGASLGYAKVEAALPGLIRETPVLTEQAVRSWHEGKVRSGPLDDDITIVVLQAVAEAV
ncbi:MAG: SpoIIE family protein phosphatase [Candidatus Ozemobacteraceae bacterium]